MEDFFDQIRQLLDKKKLKAEVEINETALVDDRRFLVIPCLDGEGQRWLFKIQYLVWENLEENFVNEVKFLGMIQNHQEIASQVSKMKDSGWLSGKIWYLREFVEGEMLGRNEDVFPYDPEVLAKLDISATARFFYNLAKIPLSEVLLAIPGIRRYDLDWQSSHENFLKNHPAALKLKEKKMLYLSVGEQERLYNLLLNPPKKILEPGSWALNHANLSPTNILFQKGRGLIFIDWENICWGFRTSGFGEFWYRCLANLKIQQAFFQARLEMEKEKKEFLQIFYFSMVVGNPGLLDYLNNLFQRGKIEKRLYENAVLMLLKVLREGMEALGA